MKEKRNPKVMAALAAFGLKWSFWPILVENGRYGRFEGKAYTEYVGSKYGISGANIGR